MIHHKIYELCKKEALEEFDQYNTDWRFFGLTTFSDLIHLETVDFSKSQYPDSQLHLIKIINFSIKAIIQKKIEPVNLPETIEDLQNNSQMSKEDFLFLFNRTWFELEEDFGKIESSNDEIIKEILKYSVYHKKNIASSTESYFSNIYELGVNAFLNLKE